MGDIENLGKRLKELREQRQLTMEKEKVFHEKTINLQR